MNECWRVVVSDQATIEIKKLLKTGALSLAEREIIRDWILFVTKNGPYKLAEFQNYTFRDHELVRDEHWKGCRLSSFSRSGRIIYRISDEMRAVEVLRITRDHNYS